MFNFNASIIYMKPTVAWAKRKSNFSARAATWGCKRRVRAQGAAFGVEAKTTQQ
jgi:hypothetical protein